jgi:hypothetical protein
MEYPRAAKSMMAHLVRDEGVAGSNPATPTRNSFYNSNFRCSRSQAFRSDWDSYWDRNAASKQAGLLAPEGLAKAKPAISLRPPRLSVAACLGATNHKVNAP